MKHLWSEYQPRNTNSVAFVLDASESAHPYWDAISSLAYDLMDRIDARTKIQIYFLGNGDCYPASQRAKRASFWFAENRRRGSFITPVFDAIDLGNVASIVVMAAGTIFDVADWDGAPALEATTFVRFGEASLTSGLRPEETPSLEALSRRIDDPVMGVTVSAENGIPLLWDNVGAYRREGLSLTAHGDADLDLRVCFAASQETPALAIVRHASGRESTASLSPCDPPASDLEWKRLPAGDRDIFDHCVAGIAFDCPQCGKERGSDHLMCQGRGALRVPVYQGLQGFQGIVLLRRVGVDLEFCAARCGAIQVSEQEVAVCCSPNRATVFRVNRAAWTDTLVSLRQYQPLEEEIYAVVL